MTKYHISPSTGRPNICRATKRACPIGGQDEHYSSKEEARSAYEVKQSGNTVAKPMKKAKATPKSIIDQLPEDPIERVTFIRDNFGKFPRPAVDSNGNRIPPVPPDFVLVEEENQFNNEGEGGYYSVDELIQIRNVGRADVLEAEAEYDGYVTMKPPSGTEASVSSDLVRKKIGMPKRTKTNSDFTAQRLSRLEVWKSEQQWRQHMNEQNRTQVFTKMDDVEKRTRKVREIHNEIQALERDYEEKQLSYSNKPARNLR